MTRLSFAAVLVGFLAMMAAHPTLADVPTTQSVAAPYTVIVPPGMQKVTVDGNTAICLPQYAAAVTKGLTNVAAATRPTTMPSDVSQRMAGVRAELVAEMSTDLGVTPQQVQTLLDQTMQPFLTRLADAHPQPYFLVATQDEISAAERSGWHAPLFYYNRLADHTFFDNRIILPEGKLMDDLVLFTEIQRGQADADISATMAAAVRDFHGSFDEGASRQAISQLRIQFGKFISEKVMDPLKFTSTEIWLGYGITGTLSCKYTSMVVGIPREALVAALGADLPNSLQRDQIDLLHPFDPNTIRPQYMMLYLDALNRKAMKVVQKLLNQSGDGAVPKILNALKAAPPRDNAALVKLIQKATGVDLKKDLLPPQ